MIAALLSTKSVEYITYSYTTDNLTIDDKGRIRIHFFHQGVKDEDFLLRWDTIPTYAQDVLKKNGALCIICSDNPLFQEERIKEIWVKEGYNQFRIM